MGVLSPAAPLIPGTTEHWASLSGHRVRYLRAGTGHPLLLLHGLLGYSFSWRFNFEALGALRQVFAPDLPGTGFSDRARVLDCSAEACARRMLQLMDAVGAEAFDLVGTSHGGGVAVMMAAIAPERVRKLVLVAPVNPWSKHGQWITRVLATPLARAAFKTAAPAFRGTNSYWLARMYGDPKRIAPGTLEGYMQPFMLNGIWDYGLNVVACWQSDLAKLGNAYARVKSETLLMWGDRDAAVFISSAPEIMKRIPQSRLETFAGVGHLPYEEVPQHFNDALETFLG
jgi:4,5:9,10-diseco-3-hydroxy-5,9,17-trioxoandrosta-1(10),2-diene-4-oate hydrolase